jgi:hypothetical protein
VTLVHIEVPDGLHRRVKSVSALRSEKLKETITTSLSLGAVLLQPEGDSVQSDLEHLAEARGESLDETAEVVVAEGLASLREGGDA